ncbi:hypothetical protein D3C86_1683690 [compost metagenome]
MTTLRFSCLDRSSYLHVLDRITHEWIDEWFPIHLLKHLLSCIDHHIWIDAFEICQLNHLSFIVGDAGNNWNRSCVWADLVERGFDAASHQLAIRKYGHNERPKREYVDILSVPNVTRYKHRPGNIPGHYVVKLPTLSRRR